MSLAIITILPLLAGFGFLYWASQLDEEWAILKLMFHLFFLPLTFLSIHLAIIDATILYGADQTLIAQLGLFVEITGYVMFLVGLYILYKIIVAIKEFLMRRKEQKKEELYG